MALVDGASSTSVQGVVQTTAVSKDLSVHSTVTVYQVRARTPWLSSARYDAPDLSVIVGGVQIAIRALYQGAGTG
jgi:hypothetical protein